MKLCFVVDARSPTVRSWISHFTGAGHQVHVISTYPCGPDAVPGASLDVVPVAFSMLAESSDGGAGESTGPKSSPARLLAGMPRGSLWSPVSKLRHWLGPLDVYRYAPRVRKIVARVGPDLVHAMRVPFEGLLAAEALRPVETPLLISIWGNDFTFHADRFPLVAWMTRRAMKRADALNTECRFNLRLARTLGFSPKKPWTALPGGGGIRPDLFGPVADHKPLPAGWEIPRGATVVLNPRGYQRHVRNDTFLRSIPSISAARPDTVFVAVGMEADRTAQRWVRRLGIEPIVRLLPRVSQEEMARLFRLADITVSPSEHDGTPNTLLEGMASGAFPVAGDIEPIREWIEHGVNGLLCDPSSPESLAKAVVDALENTELRRQARVRNHELVAQRADYNKVMASAEEFYARVIQRAGAPAQEVKAPEVV